MAKNDSKEIRTFSNGLRFALKHSNSQVAYCALSIRCGTSVEPEALSGLAHLTEHMLFKGTSRRSSASINDRLERLGGELNAYTTKEEIVIYATTLKEDVLKAIDLLFELAFDPAFAPKELEKEKGVVVDESTSARTLLQTTSSTTSRNICTRDPPSPAISSERPGLSSASHPRTSRTTPQPVSCPAI